ncbi:MAG: UDP-N-acetylglucosamine 2-epimerase (non-hydrolyzing) [Bacteroidota bacterium]
MVIICYGTRPEVIKLAPVIKAIQQKGIPCKTVFTGQHKELFEDVKMLVPTPDYHLDIMRHNQGLNQVIAAILTDLQPILQKEAAKLVIVQGDTSTVLASALCAFNTGVAVGHVEAGLRTFDLTSPFPEEANRQLVSRIATFNWAPTEIAYSNLLNEGVKQVTMTGNTVIDTCRSFDLDIQYGHKVLITLHRRENQGERMVQMFQQLEQLATQHPELEFIFPMHPNPNVQKHRHLLNKVKVMAPLNYLQMVETLSEVKFVISDSGGIQEECAAFQKRILVCRNTTERPEGITAGFAKLIDDQIINNFDWANNNPVWNGQNPYGDGNASEKITQSINEYFHYVPRESAKTVRRPTSV